MSIAKSYNKKIVSVISSMEQPLGRFAGNSLEVHECIEIMKNKSFAGSGDTDLYQDTRELSLQLAAHMIHLSGKTESRQDAYNLANEALVSGKALKVFEEMCREQGGDLAALKMPSKNLEIRASSTGYLRSFNVEKIGLAGIILRAGRMKTDDVIHPTAGIEFHVKIGDAMKSGDLIYTLLGDEPELFDEAAEMLRGSYEISLQKPNDHVLINDVLE